MAEPMVEVFIYETRQFLEQLEQIALGSEENGGFSVDDVNEIFRANDDVRRGVNPGTCGGGYFLLYPGAASAEGGCYSHYGYSAECGGFYPH